jgi:hypothetical protein
LKPDCIFAHKTINISIFGNAEKEIIDEKQIYKCGGSRRSAGWLAVRRRGDFSSK